MNIRLYPFLGAAVFACISQPSSHAQDQAAIAREVASSPFASKPSDSYSNYKDDKGKTVYPLWGSIKPLDFGSREVTFDQAGVRQLNQVPGPGIHPRIFFTPADLPEVRRRLKETKCGQEAMKNILSWTEAMKGNYDDAADYAKPDKTLGGWGGLHARVPLSRLGAPLGKTAVNGSRWNKSENAVALYKSLVDGSATNCPPYYWNTMALEAFRCLVENDEKSGKNVAQAVCTALKLGQAEREVKVAADKATALSKNKIYEDVAPAQPIGAFQLAFSYDFLFNWLTPIQKQAIHDELAVGTWSHDNYGTFNNATTSRSNWATFSYWLFEVLGIEDEPGFNALKVRGMYRGWRDLLTYGWFLSGATFEGEAKNQLGMDGIIPFAMRKQKYGFTDLCGHPYLKAYATKFLPHSSNPMLAGFHKYDLLGGSRTGKGGFTPCDILGLKYMFPDDKAIDWVYRESMGEDYSGVPDRPDGYFNGLLFFAIFASDFDASNGDVSKLNLGNTFFCGERALMMTRSSWDTNATMLNMHIRQANGGHAFADRNALMVAGAGRIWSPNGYASFKTSENSLVCIDNKTQMVNTPGRLVDFVDTPLATFAVGDAKYCWDWQWVTLEKKGGGFYNLADVRSNKVVIPAGYEPEMHTINDFAYTKLPYPYLNKPFIEEPSWILPAGALTPVVRGTNYPVLKAFRTAGLVRGTHPYILALDDIQKDATKHHYDWNLTLECDVQIALVTKNTDGTMDILLTGTDPNQKDKPSKEALPGNMIPGTVIPANQPMLLVRVLQADGLGEPRVETSPNQTGTRYPPIRRLVLPSDSVSPGFKVLLYPHRQGTPLPETKWNEKKTAIVINWPEQQDTVAFSGGTSGKTHLTLTRKGIDQPLISLTKEPAPLQ